MSKHELAGVDEENLLAIIDDNEAENAELRSKLEVAVAALKKCHDASHRTQVINEALATIEGKDE
jgi:hypothetical protein